MVPIHIMPQVKSIITLFFENLLPVLKKRTDVQMIWLVYQPEKINRLQQIATDVTIVDIHDYNNAVDLLKKEKPDIIFTAATRSFIDYALSSAAKFLNIPIFSMFWSDWYYSTTRKTTNVKMNINRFFESSIPTDTNQNQKQMMRRGRFYIYKYLFLLRTQIATKMNILKIIVNFFMLLKHNLLDLQTDSRFANTIHFLEDEKLQEILVEAGFPKSTLIVTGNPLFDKSLQKSLEQKTIGRKNEDKVRVLLAPSTLYEHGFWTREQRDTTIKEIIAKIFEKKDKLSIIIKIHPSTSLLSEYKSIINSIDSSIPVYQKGDIQEFLENTDVIVTFQSSTAEVYGVIARKPIVICNFFNSEKDMLVEKGVAIECTDSSYLTKSIEQAISNNPEYEQKRDDFIKEFMYKADGCAAERICDMIMELLDKKQN